VLLPHNAGENSVCAVAFGEAAVTLHRICVVGQKMALSDFKITDAYRIPSNAYFNFEIKFTELTKYKLM
jgi:hypothetical protein